MRFHGKEHLDRALARGKGVVIVLGHSGPHHVALLLMALMQYRLVGIRDRKEGALRRYVQEQLAKSFPEFGAVRMFFSDAYPRELYRALQDEYILCGALDVSRDRGAQSSTSRVRIFGREQDFVNGAMKIALRCGAPVLQGFIVARRDFYFRLTVTEPLIDPETVGQDEQAAIDAAMQKYADNVEQHVQRYPCQLSRI